MIVSVGEIVFVGVGDDVIDDTIAVAVGETVWEKAAPTNERMLRIRRNISNQSFDNFFCEK